MLKRVRKIRASAELPRVGAVDSMLHQLAEIGVVKTVLSPDNLVTFLSYQTKSASADRVIVLVCGKPRLFLPSISPKRYDYQRTTWLVVYIDNFELFTRIDISSIEELVCTNETTRSNFIKYRSFRTRFPGTVAFFLTVGFSTRKPGRRYTFRTVGLCHAYAWRVTLKLVCDLNAEKDKRWL